MPLILQTVITEEDVMLNYNIRYVIFIPERIPVKEVLKDNHICIRYKLNPSRVDEEDYYSGDTEKAGYNKIKKDLEDMELLLKKNEIVVYSGREYLSITEEIEPYSEKIYRLIERKIASFHGKYFNKENFWN